MTNKTLLELPREQSFHDYRGAGPHPLQGVQTLSAGGMGEGLARRLAGMGIEGLVTPETDPDQTVAAWLAGTLPLGQAEAHGDHGHAHS